MTEDENVGDQNLTDAEWREFQEIPDQGYSHRAWIDHRIAERILQATDEYDALMTRMGDLLTGVAAGLKGPPPPLTMHDWSDLPVVAKRIAEELDITSARWVQSQSDLDEERIAYDALVERLRTELRDFPYITFTTTQRAALALLQERIEVALLTPPDHQGDADGDGGRVERGAGRTPSAALPPAEEPT